MAFLPRSLLKRRARPASGFTLLEVLVVIAIIVFLFTLIATVATKVRDRARMSRTKALVKRIHTVLDAYRAVYREYPSGGPLYPDTWPSPYVATGVVLDKSIVYRGLGLEDGTFNREDFDQATGNIFVDPWGHPLRYRKVAPTQMLVWSYGMNGVDEIGPGKIWDDKLKAYSGGTGGGMQERMGDDISQNDMDY